METTFGLPQYVMPPTYQVLADIIHFCRQTLEDNEVPVLFGYSLGKSQELLSSMAEANLPVMLHPQILKMTRIYEELDQVFPPYLPFTPTDVAGHVVLCPPQASQSAWLRKIKARRTAMVTGWAMDPSAKYRYQCDAVFPLSDHADFADLLRLVEMVQPKRVYTVHGFVEEFAQTLRKRGVEAWALGMATQLEISLTEATRKASAHPIATAGQQTPLPRNDFLIFAQTAEKIRATAKKSEKVDFLKEYLLTLPHEDLAPAAISFTGRPFPPSDGRTLNCGWAIIKEALLGASGMSESDYRSTYRRYSDGGETAEAMLQGHSQPRPWPISELPLFFTKLATIRGPSEKRTFLQNRMERLDALAAKYLVKIITGDLRIGLKEGLVEEAVAAAFDQSPEAIREANMLSGDLGATAQAARLGTLDELQLKTFQPIHFMLASPEPTAEAIVKRMGESIWLEEKYDGIRCQVHKQGERAELYSRELRRITTQFPDVVAHVQKIPGDFIADGELLAWQHGRALPFAELQKRLGRKGDDFFLGAEIPVSLLLYDLLGHLGQSLLKLPLSERRARLEQLPLISGVELAPYRMVRGESEIETAFLRSRQRGNEGLMAKDPSSIYLPGRRGLGWLKLKKAYATLDVVVVGVEWGHGKRRDMLSDYTFAVRDEKTDQLLPVGKAYSGLTDAEILHYTDFFLQHTLEEKGRFRVVQPEIILEVAFDRIQPSSRHVSGYALRFPRIVRIRDDKPVSQIDTLATCRNMADAVAQEDRGIEHP
jgi:DNA ligase-1